MNFSTEQHLGYPVGGCCAIACTYGFVYDTSLGNPSEADKEKFRQQEASKLKAFEQRALESGKSIMFTSVRDDQTFMEKILIESGYVSPFEDWSYRSPERSTHRKGMKIYVKQLWKPEAA